MYLSKPRERTYRMETLAIVAALSFVAICVGLAVLMLVQVWHVISNTIPAV